MRNPRQQSPTGTVPVGSPRRTRWALLRRALWTSIALLVAAAPGCDDSPSNPPSGLLLETPLTLDWNGKDNGLPFESRGEWKAQANLRALWKFRLEARPADPEDPRWHGTSDPPRYTTTFPSQELIWFAWNIGMVNANCYAFARGDTCTARVELTPALAPGEESKAVFKFVIGG